LIRDISASGEQLSKDIYPPPSFPIFQGGFFFDIDISGEIRRRRRYNNHQDAACFGLSA